MHRDDLVPDTKYAYNDWDGSRMVLRVKVVSVVQAPPPLVTVRYETGFDEGTKKDVDPRFILGPWKQYLDTHGKPGAPKDDYWYDKYKEIEREAARAKFHLWMALTEIKDLKANGLAAKHLRSFPDPRDKAKAQRKLDALRDEGSSR